MAETSFYVYALKDPRTDPAKPFYVGKGTGTRAYDHLIKPDESAKGRLIREIMRDGHTVLVTRIVDGISEEQAMRIEAELISAFGTLDTGGMLTNSVVPTGIARKARRTVVVPQGAKEKAQVALRLLKDAILEFARVNPAGITNADAASLLGLRSDYGGGSRDYLSYSVIGLLMRECCGARARARGTWLPFAKTTRAVYELLPATRCLGRVCGQWAPDRGSDPWKSAGG